MTFSFLIGAILLCSSGNPKGLSNDSSSIQLRCEEKFRKNPEGVDPIIIKSCILKQFKIVNIGSPDRKGRYSYEHRVYRKVNGKFIRSVNSAIFNNKQGELLSLINQKIQAEFNSYATDINTKGCFTSVTSIPQYKMNDLGISFYGDEIWFSVNFGLSSSCRSVDGAIAIFKLSEISKYLNEYTKRI